MKTQTLKNKLIRYAEGKSFPTEQRQIQDWLSYLNNNQQELSSEELSRLELDTLIEVQCLTNYQQKGSTMAQSGWWRKFTAVF